MPSMLSLSWKVSQTSGIPECLWCPRSFFLFGTTWSIIFPNMISMNGFFSTPDSLIHPEYQYHPILTPCNFIRWRCPFYPVVGALGTAHHPHNPVGCGAVGGVAGGVVEPLSHHLDAKLMLLGKIPTYQHQGYRYSPSLCPLSYCHLIPLKKKLPWPNK